MDLRTLARYPFLPGAAEAVKEMGVSLSDLVSSPAFEGVRQKGVERVMAAVIGGSTPMPVLSGEEGVFSELLSYPVARMVVSCTGDRALARRFSVAEAKRASRLLSEEDVPFLLEFGEVFGVECRLHSHEYGDVDVFFTHYLKYVSRMRSSEWKLVNQNIRKGWVALEKARFVRMLENVVLDAVGRDLPLPVGGDIMKVFGAVGGSILSVFQSKRREVEEIRGGRVSVRLFPPCMRDMLARAQNGENLSHNARFALTAFLHAVGMSNEDILAVFSSSPDFSEKIASYQIEHITGASGGTEYSPPSCDSLKTLGLCPGEDRLCALEWMNHPLTYYRAKMKDVARKKREARKKEADKTASGVGGEGDG